MACLGEVPEHWEVKRLSLIGSFFKGGGGTKEDEVEDGVPCVRYGDIYTQHQFFIRETRSDISEESAAKYTPIHYGDILFAGSGETVEEIGKSAANLIEGPAYCGGDVIVLRPVIEFDATFLGYAADCSTSTYQKAYMGRGVTVMHIYGQELKRLLLPLPPIAEQRAIGAFLDRETERIDSLAAKMRLLIERLSEYRTALITAAVTGKIDVRASAESPEAHLTSRPPMTSHTDERAFELTVESMLLEGGWRTGDRAEWNAERALFSSRAAAFIRETQPDEWARIASLHGDEVEALIIDALARELDLKGVLEVLRHGFRFYGRTFRIAYFATGLQPEPPMPSLDSNATSSP